MTLRFWPGVLFLAGVLLAIELLFLPRAGLQADEVLFLTPFLKGAAPLYSWHLGPVRIPIMIMDYIGALKSWLYWPILQLYPMSVWTVRLPACLISVATAIVFGDTVRRVAGTTVALFAALCLVTDATFILTNVYDWGPVALLLLGTVAFLNLLLRYSENRDLRYLGAAFLIAGLAAWYKAVFVFPLTAIIAALALVWFKGLRGRLSLRNTACAAACFVAGVSPLIAFNISHPGATLAATAYLDRAALGEKTMMMRLTLEGRALEHYIFRAVPHEQIQLTGAPLSDLVETWYRTSQLGPGSALPWLLPLSLAALPFLRRLSLFRPLLFAWIAAAGLFFLMLIFRDAGAGPHHTVLINPAPQFIVAATLAALATRVPRGLLVFAGALLIASNLYLLSQYYDEAKQNGFSVYWTDGSRPLTNVIRMQPLPAAFLDWGVRDVVRVQSGDTINLAPDTDPHAGVLYVGHCDGYVIDPAQSNTFEQKLALSGLHRIQVERVSDPHGEPLFCMSVLGK